MIIIRTPKLAGVTCQNPNYLAAVPRALSAAGSFGSESERAFGLQHLRVGESGSLQAGAEAVVARVHGHQRVAVVQFVRGTTC